ncbi:cation transporting ATPase C-terminal domain-containing protein [Massilia sp. B-10]|nr:cation transporting ATPase C-terminal domain-containing protein [Massilia sp. B-10]UUZ57399.1 cation transporting ATPase C-terminal domain-containing protein [Massilia sp. H-1]
MTLCVAFALPTPLLPIHLLWINLVTDGLPALCLATDHIDADVMRRPPRGRGERMTDRRFVVTMLLTGLFTAGAAFGVYVYLLRTGSVEMARTHAFAVLVFAELLRAFGAQRNAARLAHSPAHQPGAGGDRVPDVLAAGLEPSQRGPRTLAQDQLPAAGPMPAPAGRRRHSPCAAGAGQAGHTGAGKRHNTRIPANVNRLPCPRPNNRTTSP